MYCQIFVDPTTANGTMHKNLPVACRKLNSYYHFPRTRRKSKSFKNAVQCIYVYECAGDSENAETRSVMYVAANKNSHVQRFGAASQPVFRSSHLWHS